MQMGENDQINVMVSELEHDDWYDVIIYYMKNLSCPNHLLDHKSRALKLKSMKCYLTQDGLGWKSPDGIILRCVNKDEANQFIKELYSGYCSGHFTSNTTTHKILRARYYWPTSFKDTHQYAMSYQPCQFFTGKQQLPNTGGSNLLAYTSKVLVLLEVGTRLQVLNN